MSCTVGQALLVAERFEQSKIDIEADRERRLSNGRWLNFSLTRAADALIQPVGGIMQHDFKNFIRHGGNGAYVIRQRSGLTFGHSLLTKSQSQDENHLSQAFRQRL